MPKKNDKPQHTSVYANWIVPVMLAAFLLAVYLMTLHPGVGRGDTAELQFNSAVLGVCHRPGYAIEVSVGRLFSALPFGPNVAWRINLLMTLCGVAGCLALYGTVRRITGSVLGGCIAAATLGLSSVFWPHSVMAEVYVFYSMFLLAGLWTTVRFVQSDKAAWLYATAFLLGVCVGDRASELFVLAGFAGACLAFRKRVRIGPRRTLLAALLFVLPFCYSVGFFLMRHVPSNLHARDRAFRDTVVPNKPGEVGPAELGDMTYLDRFGHAVQYCLGVKWVEKTGITAEQVKYDLAKYGWMMSGRYHFTAAEARRHAPLEVQRSGSSLGLIGVAAALLGLIRWRKHYGWLILAVGMVVGNLLFYLWHHAPDNLTFTIPSLAGWCMLVGLGVSGPPGRTAQKRWPSVARPAWLIVPGLLLILNWPLVRANQNQQSRYVEYCKRVAEADFPVGTIIIDRYWQVTAWRYVLFVEAGRTDMRVLIPDDKGPELIKRLLGEGEVVFVSRTTPLQTLQIDPSMLVRASATTAQLGFARLNPRKYF